ncbi:MAG TPA: hypothetical protein VJ599_01660 [Nitrososphaeraceae archaeon]|nr:hypothetical protein [Nitrososphaeraceae archaeon]
MNKGKKYHLLVISSVIAISITAFISAQPTYATDITIYSPYWLDYEKHPGASYFKYCGIFDSCFRNEIRLFPFLPLTTSQQEVNMDKDNSPKNIVSPILPPKKTVTSIIPFELPFP